MFYQSDFYFYQDWDFLSWDSELLLSLRGMLIRLGEEALSR